MSVGEMKTLITEVNEGYLKFWSKRPPGSRPAEYWVTAAKMDTKKAPRQMNDGGLETENCL